MDVDDRDDIAGKRDEARVRKCLQGFPEGVIESALGYFAAPDRTAFDRALRGILAFHLPAQGRHPLDDAPASTRLREDLGLDSLALAEAAFVADDLFRVPLPMRELHALSTLGELEEFLWTRLAATRRTEHGMGEKMP